ncbi:YegS/Rv2252/BmrU family lipid kinase [Alloiococcus sp. CFN-8]|uniref:YegS/Rv2252/BmrU family lipid kinase n=1 Tax=Alloiococcus sp. CFN-8 TaxID=3416081 RepID=UPI003CED7FE9
MKKAKLIYNPKSGKEEASSSLDVILSLYEEKGFQLTPLRLQEGLDLKEELKDINEYHHIAIMGGDGTLNSIVNELKKNKVDIPIAIIPAGTANDMARHLNISEDIEECVTKILSTTPKKMDIGKANDSYFMNMASTGMFSNPFEATEDDKKTKLGKLAYMVTGITQINKIQPFEFNIKSKEYNYQGSSLGVILLNGSSIANVDLAPEASEEDGLLDVLVFSKDILENKLKVALKLIMEGSLEELEGVYHYRSSEVYIECPSQPLTDLDGERGPSLPGVFKCIKNGISILGI